MYIYLLLILGIVLFFKFDITKFDAIEFKLNKEKKI